MPKKNVTEFTCDRCTRVWYTDTYHTATMVLEFLEPDKEPTSRKFDVLCVSCTNTLRNYIQRLITIGKGKSEANEEAPGEPDTSSEDL
jgi:hypothetical protein